MRALQNTKSGSGVLVRQWDKQYDLYYSVDFSITGRRKYKYLKESRHPTNLPRSMNASGHSAVCEVRGFYTDRKVSHDLHRKVVCLLLSCSLTNRYLSNMAGQKYFVLLWDPLCMNKWRGDVVFDQRRGTGSWMPERKDRPEARPAEQ